MKLTTAQTNLISDIEASKDKCITISYPPVEPVYYVGDFLDGRKVHHHTIRTLLDKKILRKGKVGDTLIIDYKKLNAPEPIRDVEIEALRSEIDDLREQVKSLLADKV